jgi:hypothetical protein
MCSVQLIQVWLAYLGTICSVVITCHVNCAENENLFLLVDINSHVSVCLRKWPYGDLSCAITETATLGYCILWITKVCILQGM